MAFEEYPLPLRADPHLQQRRPIRHRRHNQIALFLKRNEPLIEQVINRGE